MLQTVSFVLKLASQFSSRASIISHLLFPTQFDSIQEARMLKPEIFKPENV
jgi:hypothetical protein